MAMRATPPADIGNVQELLLRLYAAASTTFSDP